MARKNIIRSLLKRISALFVLLSIPALLGALGYVLFENWDVFDSIYTTVCLLTTASYAPPNPATLPGKMLTMLLSLIGVSFIILAVSAITAPLLEENIEDLLQEEKTKWEHVEISPIRMEDIKLEKKSGGKK